MILPRLSLVVLVVLAVPACAKDAVAPSTPAPLCVASAAPASAAAAPAPSGPATTPWLPDAPHKLNIPPAQLESLRKQREAAEQRRREPHEPWNPSSVARWKSALEGYASSVKPGNQTALNAAAVPFASYLNGMHNRIHPLFADRFLDAIDDLPARNPLNSHHNVTRLEIVLTEEGRVRRMGVIKSSGVAEFDVGALDAVDRAQPFEPAPSALRSADGDVYVHWEFYRDEVFACSTMHARPFLLIQQAANP